VSAAFAIPIVALDVPTAAEAMALARALGDRCRFYKVGSELFTAAGPDIVRQLRDEVGADVFLDLKFHDIPNTVAGAVRTAAKLEVRLLTVHASGGPPMLEAAQQAASDAAGADCGVLATSKVRRAVKVPLIGIGGVSTAEDALQYLIAGATLVGIGTAMLRDPRAPERIVRDLAHWCERHGVGQVGDVVGSLEGLA